LTSPPDRISLVSSAAAFVETARQEQVMWSFGYDPTLGGAVGAGEARRAELAAAVAEDEREEQHANEDYEAAKARAAASRPSTRWGRTRRLLRLDR
jgi:hypothetical protein